MTDQPQQAEPPNKIADVSRGVIAKAEQINLIRPETLDVLRNSRPRPVI